MATINLRDFYPYYNTDNFVEVDDNIVEAMHEAERIEKNHLRRMYWNKAHYSLDKGDGIEREAVFAVLPPSAVYEHKWTVEQLYAALDTLPDLQGRRIYAHYILGMSKTQIAKVEGVAKSRVTESIQRGLRNMGIFLDKMDL